MRLLRKKIKYKSICVTGISTFFRLLFLFIFISVSSLNASESTLKFGKGSDTLVVYTDVPGLAPSEFYSIKVRSAATNNEWVECFANITRNLAFQQKQDSSKEGSTIRHYQWFTNRWSHTWGNIEMNPNSPVEVEISSKNGFKIAGKDFFKAAIHPSHKANEVQVLDGKIYFTISNPASITVDINGQMDDYNAAINPIGEPVHAITLFAHPLMDKPKIEDDGIVVVKPGQKLPTDPSTYKTLYFSPGIHDIGIGFKVHPNRKYYIPGDAIVYGTFNNIGVPVGNAQANGEKVKIYGLGTISGDRTSHPAHDENKVLDDKEYKTIAIENGLYCEVEGVFIANPAFHSVNLVDWIKRDDKSAKVTFARWVKVISWRANGDGIGSAHVVEDCFLRCGDDCSYIKGDRIRCTFWKDANAAVFHMAGIPEAKENFPILIDDCDVLYNRSRSDISGSGIFVQRAQGNKGQRPVNVTVQNFRVHDKIPNAPIFRLAARFDEKPARTKFHGVGSSFSGLSFKNISAAKGYDKNGDGKTEYILGAPESPWNGGVTFENIVIDGKRLTNLNNFYTNEFVNNIFVK